MAEKLLPYIEKNNEIYQVYDIRAHNAINNINTVIVDALHGTDSTLSVKGMAADAEAVGKTMRGQPIAVTNSIDFSNQDLLYLYLGEEDGFEYGHIYVYIDGAWVSTELYGKGEQGEPGADAFTPMANVVETQTGIRVTITDKNGTTSAEVSNGTATDAQVNAWLEAHPEATTTVQDGTITGAKLASDVADKTYEPWTPDSFVKETWRFAVKSSGTIYNHAWNKNWNIVSEVTTNSIKISAVSAYINYAWVTEQPTANTAQTAVAYGGTYDGYTRHLESDALSPALHEIEIIKPDNADFIIVDFGYTDPTDVELSSWDGTSHHIKNEMITPESIPDNAVSSQKLQNNAVTQEKIIDDAITGKKIKKNEIDGDHLTNGFRYTSSAWPDALILIAEGYEFVVEELKIATAYPDRSCLWAYKLKAGHCYRIGPPHGYNTSYSDLFSNNNPDKVSNVNHNIGWIGTKLLTEPPIPGNVNSMDGYICKITSLQAFCNVPAAYGTVYGNTGKMNSGAFLLVGETDLYVYFCGLKPIAPQKFMKSSLYGFIIYEFDKNRINPEIASDGYQAPNVTWSFDGYSGRFTRSYSGYSTELDDVAVDVLNDFSIGNSEKLDIALGNTKKPLKAIIIGDSIVYAASNAGLQNAWRKYISTKLGLYETTHMSLTVSGTGLVDGFCFDWTGKAPSADGYDSTLTGVSGIKKYYTDMLEGDRTIWAHSGIGTGMMYAIATDTYDLAIVSLGTNDWGNNGTLGSINTLNDTATFYGAVHELFTFLTTTLHTKNVLFVAPFPRKDGTGLNEASTPYYLWEIAHALAEIAVIHPNMHVLDLTNAWYFDVSNNAIATKSFIDKVHISGFAHHLVTMDMAREIERIIAYDPYRR